MKKAFKLSPEEYNKILKNIELMNISIIKTQAEIDRNIVSGKLNINTKSRVKFTQDDKSLNVIYSYNLLLFIPEKNVKVALIKVNFEIIFIKLKKIEISQDFFEIFKEVSLKYTLWPYFREFVQNMILRMNLPPLTLPMVKAI